jgi:AcrR family transcriptional regulator
MPKIVDLDQKRTEFVEASWNVIASEGLKAATMRRVAAEAGCTTGALTHYFSDRRALLIGALRAAHFQAGERMLNALKQDASPLERLRSVLHEGLPLDEIRLREWRIWLAFWAESMNDPELAAEDQRRYAEWADVLDEALDPLIDIKSQMEREVAHLIALVDGLGVKIARHNGPASKIKQAQMACENILARHIAQFENLEFI